MHDVRFTFNHQTLLSTTLQEIVVASNSKRSANALIKKTLRKGIIKVWICLSSDTLSLSGFLAGGDCRAIRPACLPPLSSGLRVWCCTYISYLWPRKGHQGSWILTDKQRRENIEIFLMEIKWIFNSLFVTIYIIYLLLTCILDFKASAKVSWNHFHQNKSDCKVFWDRKLAFSWHIVFQWSMKYKIILKPRCSISIHNTFRDRRKYINDSSRQVRKITLLWWVLSSTFLSKVRFSNIEKHLQVEKNWEWIIHGVDHLSKHFKSLE